MWTKSTWFCGLRYAKLSSLSRVFRRIAYVIMFVHTGAPGRNKTSQLMSFCSLLDSLALVVVYFAHHGVRKCSWIIRSIIAVVNILLRHGPIQGLSFRCLAPLNPPRISCRDPARWHPRFYTCSSDEDVSNIKSRGIETNTTICLPVILICFSPTYL